MAEATRRRPASVPETPDRPDRMAGLAATASSAHATAASVRSVAAAVLRPVTSIITPLGRGVLLFGFGCWLLGWRGGWQELMVVAAAAWLLVAVSLVLTIGRAKLAVTLTADPQRVVVGAPAAGSVHVRNESRASLLPIGLELPVGTGAARYTLPLLAPGAEHEELFVVPTLRRGVVTVGPATTVRGDPLGLLRRAVTWTDSIELFVHPITVRIDSLGAGILRDLEGQTTNELSMSDLEFHALRDYQPGDDSRYIHWKSSAKAEPGRFLVRQFLDTRRSHVALVVDGDSNSYGDENEFELAISAAASIAIRTVNDGQEVTVLAGNHTSVSAHRSRILDTFSRGELSGHGLTVLARRTIRLAPDVSLAILVTGPNTSFEHLQRSANEFAIETRVVALQIAPDRRTGFRKSPRLTVLTLQRLGDLASLLSGVAA